MNELDKHQKINKTKDFLRSNFIFFSEDVSLRNSTYFKSGGLAKILAYPQSTQKLKELITHLHEEDAKFKIIGNTSNIMFIDEIDYSIIISTKNLSNIKIEEATLTAEAGYMLPDLSRISLLHCATGFEGLEGIPATVGGAVFMNAGAYGCCISDNLQSVTCITNQGNIITLFKSECQFKYRKSIFTDSSLTIISATFKLNKGSQDSIASKMETYHIARHTYQDFTYPNLGSMISMSNIYLEVLSKNKPRFYIYWILRLIYKNPISKFIHRKKPHSRPFNNLLLSYIRKKHNISLRYAPSKKNANTLINSGKNSTIEIISYIHGIHKLIEKRFPVENEIILEAIYKINCDEQTFIEIQSIASDLKHQ